MKRSLLDDAVVQSMRYLDFVSRWLLVFRALRLSRELHSSRNFFYAHPFEWIDWLNDGGLRISLLAGVLFCLAAFSLEGLVQSAFDAMMPLVWVLTALLALTHLRKMWRHTHVPNVVVSLMVTTMGATLSGVLFIGRQSFLEAPVHLQVWVAFCFYLVAGITLPQLALLSLNLLLANWPRRLV